MKEYETVWEIFNECANNQMRMSLSMRSAQMIRKSLCWINSREKK